MQDYNKDGVEILIIDGMSNDGTKEFLGEYVKKHGNVRVIDNPEGIVPKALNIGIKEAKGEIVLRADGHSSYAVNYASKCVEYLEKTGADNVGGPMRAKGEGFVGSAIAMIHGFPFGLGGGKFHNEAYEGEVDTVYLGCWKKEVFDKYGLFDERLVRNQDIEHNARIRKGGGKIFLTPEIKSEYFVRSGLIGLAKQNFMNGFWNIKTTQIAPGTLSWRHFIPLVFVLSLMVSSLYLPAMALILVSYIGASVFSAVILSMRHGFAYFFMLPVIFAVLHVSYGLGSLVGIISAIVDKIRLKFSGSK